MWSKLTLRVVSGCVAGALVLVLLFLPNWVFDIAVAVASLMILYELFTTFKQEKKWQLVLLDYLGALGLIFASEFAEAKKNF